MFDEFDLQKYKEKKTKSIIIITITIIEPADIIRRYNIILLLLCMYTIGAIISYSTVVDRALCTSVPTPVQRGTNRLLGTHNVQYTQVLCLHRISLLYYLVFYYCCYFISLFARPPIHYYVAVYIHTYVDYNNNAATPVNVRVAYICIICIYMYIRICIQVQVYTE